MDANMGKLDTEPALARADLLAPPVAAALAALDGTLPADAVGVAEIDPALADTAAFCERYGVSPAVSANCVVITGRREGQPTLGRAPETQGVLSDEDWAALGDEDKAQVVADRYRRTALADRPPPGEAGGEATLGVVEPAAEPVGQGQLQLAHRGQ